ncbi:MAG: nucleoside hydrolase [Anaerolineaceae bacterium]|nr:nucleoside hydrolase [Anaerolineaceae bacterium]
MRKFWIDTDTASDDAVAILMALQAEDVEVIGISVVAGNVPVDQGCQNAGYTIELCGKETPLYRGAERPLVREPSWAFFFHGPDGMGGMNYPPTKTPVQKGAVEAMVAAIRENPGEITLITLGPLTNIANALCLAPDIAEKVKICYMMAGAANTVGNITPSAEYNVWFDPEAAHAVYHSGMKMVQVGWELCRGEANISDEEQKQIHQIGTELAHFSMDCNRQAIATNKQWLGDPSLPLPDPITMAIALDPSIVKNAGDYFVDIAYGLPATDGMTVVDERKVTHKPENVNVIWEIDIPAWKRILYDSVG